MYAIRITKAYNDLTDFFNKLDKVTDRYVFYQHNVPNNVHIHGLLEGCKVSTDTLKNYIRKDVGNMKSTDWSFKTAQSRDFITYMSKGELNPCVVKDFEDDEINEYKSKWVPIEHKRKQLTQYKLKIENPVQAKARQNDLMDQVLLRCREQGVTHGRPVLEIIRQVVYVEHRTITGRYKIRDYYDYVLGNGLHKDMWLDNMEKLILVRDI